MKNVEIAAEMLLPDDYIIHEGGTSFFVAPIPSIIDFAFGDEVRCFLIRFEPAPSRASAVLAKIDAAQNELNRFHVMLRKAQFRRDLGHEAAFNWPGYLLHNSDDICIDATAVAAAPDAKRFPHVELFGFLIRAVVGRCAPWQNSRRYVAPALRDGRIHGPRISGQQPSVRVPFCDGQNAVRPQPMERMASAFRWRTGRPQGDGIGSVWLVTRHLSSPQQFPDYGYIRCWQIQQEFPDTRSPDVMPPARPRLH